jgi:hypothetical protein
MFIEKNWTCFVNANPVFSCFVIAVGSVMSQRFKPRREVTQQLGGVCKLVSF